MKNAFEAFCRGAGYVFYGIKLFYSTPRWWRYATPPLVMAVVLYLGLAILFFGWLVPALEQWLFAPDQSASPPEWLEWLYFFLRGVFKFTAALLGMAVVAATFAGVYEMFGSLIFDSLSRRCELELYRTPENYLSWSQNLRLTIECTWFGLVSGVIALPLFLLSLVLPTPALLLAAGILGYRLGISYLFPAGFNRMLEVSDLRIRAAGHKMSVLGFGVTAYLLLMIPGAALLFLPGLAVAGIIMSHEEHIVC